MKLLDRYLIRQFLATFFMLVMGLPLLFIIGDITDHIDTYMDRGVPHGQDGAGVRVPVPAVHGLRVPHLRPGGHRLHHRRDDAAPGDHGQPRPAA